MTRTEVYDLINRERDKQIAKYGSQEDKINGRWLPVLVAEVGEVAENLSKNIDSDLLRHDLVQVAAVACAWLETKF